MMNFIKPEYLVSLYLILNKQEEVSLKDLGNYGEKLNKELKEQMIEALFLYSDKYIEEMLSDYKDYFVNSGFNYCTPWIKRKVSNEELSEKFTSYLSNDVLKVASDLKTKEKTMTTEEKIEVMKAYTEGKTIQFRVFGGAKTWEDIRLEPVWDWDSCLYRVKSESEYRPYKNIEEMHEDIKKRLNETFWDIQHPVFPGIWLKQKEYEVEEMIAGIDPVKSEILLGKNWISVISVFKHYTYRDDSPFGVKE